MERPTTYRAEKTGNPSPVECQAKSMLTDQERMLKLLTASPAIKSRVDAILQGIDSVSGIPDTDCRLVTYTEAARRMGVSRPTIYRLAHAGRLEIVPLNGVNRIRLQSVVDCINGKGAK